jgi:ABC-type glutathione transport system ATPase component
VSRGAANRPRLSSPVVVRIADGHGPRAPKTVSGNGDSAVRLVGARKIYGDVPAVDGIDLEIAADEFFPLPRLSGSGKTTCLRIIAAFERPDDHPHEVHTPEQTC